MGILDRLQHAWNAFVGEDTRRYNYIDFGYSSSIRPDRVRFSKGNERSMVTAVYNRIALDCCAVDLQHVRLDEHGRFSDVIDSGLNSCLSLEANKDQASRPFLQDVIMSLFDEGVVAIIPIDTTVDPTKGGFDIETMRTGKIIQWYPDYVKVQVYNDNKGIKEELTVHKSKTAIVENPFYAIMNEKNSILQRLIRKLNLLDVIDEQTGSGKLDLIIQLPYIIKTAARRKQAEERKKDLEDQLASSKYGVAYTDGTEKITQLNRPVENSLLKQIEYLTGLFYSQLCITTSILDGTADEKTMLNYMNRVVEPIVDAIAEEMRRKFLTKTARTQKQSIMYFNDPFRLVPKEQLADIADKFTRNEIMSSNEFRQIIRLKPIKDSKADELRNKNLNAGEGQSFAKTKEGEEDSTTIVKEEQIQNGKNI